MTNSSGVLRVIVAQFLALAALAALAPAPVLASQAILSGGGGNDMLWGQGQGRSGPTGVGGAVSARSYTGRGIPTTASGVSVPTHVQVAGVLNRAGQLCAAAPREYRLDCVILHLRRSAQAIPQYGTLGEAREILDETADRLNTILKANQDTARPPIRLQTRDSALEPVTPRLRAVKAEAVAQVNRQAARVLAEAETRLLRSASKAGPAATQFTRIAAAVGSNKVLLRS